MSSWDDIVFHGEEFLSGLLINKKIINNSDIIAGEPLLLNKDILEQLSIISLDTYDIINVLSEFSDIFIDISSRWLLLPPSEENIFKIFWSFGSILPIIPDIELLALKWLEMNNIFSYIRNLELNENNKNEENNEKLAFYLLTIYRFLHYKRSMFKFIVDINALNKILNYKDPVLKILTIEILSIYFNYSEELKLNLFQKYTNSQNEPIIGLYYGENVDYFFIALLESQRLSKWDEKLKTSKSKFASQKNLYRLKSVDLSPYSVNFAGIIVTKFSQNSYTNNNIFLIITKTSTDSIYNIATKFLTNNAIMLLGPSGCGKSFYIDYIAQKLGKGNDIVRIHLGEQTDAKILIGTYSTDDTPGSIIWKPGVLTQAVIEGKWVVVEDIDKAPSEVISVLLPLIEKRQILIPSQDSNIYAHKEFRLISTMKTPVSKEILEAHLWNKVLVNMPTDSELELIINSKFPVLTEYSNMLVSTFSLLRNELMNDSRFLNANKVKPREVSISDLLKWCERISISAFKFNADKIIINSDNFFLEAFDCFIGSLQSDETKKIALEYLCKALDFPLKRAALLLERVPSLHVQDSFLTVGRAKLHQKSISVIKTKSVYANTSHSLRLLEQISVATSLKEPLLLVGETGTGKTTTIQHLAKLTNNKLVVINVSQQMESSDLLGGYKPIDVKTLAMPLMDEFSRLFECTFSVKKNARFSAVLNKCIEKGQWGGVIKAWTEAYKMAVNYFNRNHNDTQSSPQEVKRRKFFEIDTNRLDDWSSFMKQIEAFDIQRKAVDKSLMFKFVEGALIRAVKRGDWVLLDEVNLASADTLESIAELLSSEKNQNFILSEKGDMEAIKVHDNFRLFACMNPATDIGKRDLPSGIRTRFTELFVESPDKNFKDLLHIISQYIGSSSYSDEKICQDIANLYLEIKGLTDRNEIVDGSNNSPLFSIRSLTRTLSYSLNCMKIYGLRRALYEGFCVFFLSSLDEASEIRVHKLLELHILSGVKNLKAVLKHNPAPKGGNEDFVQFDYLWINKGDFPIKEQKEYILTPSIKRNLMNIIRAIFGKNYPILIEGPTSSGKTSMIKYIAQRSGHKFVRINNHEHTDLQEYIGTYIADSSGKLIFQEGVLVEALRNGYWLVLDELNLAPTDVLEALNRLLDDNRELFIPETQTTIKPHPNFMLFATQNPPGLYGGRKLLSRAFRNRFLELHFSDIPEEELERIICGRCHIPPSYAKKIVEVYQKLASIRLSSRVFEQRNSFATLRDLFRWALRDAIGYEQLALNGYFLIAERVRNSEEKEIVKNVLENVMKVKLDLNSVYNAIDFSGKEQCIVWTNSMKRLYTLVSAALKNHEPILLVGETGCGKTTICQFFAEVLGKKLYIVNAHQNTETSDLIGSQRPIRNRSQVQNELYKLLQSLFFNEDFSHLDDYLNFYEKSGKSKLNSDDIARIESLKKNILNFFEWSDGALVKAMRQGDLFLLDEIALAEDSVLERLNSVLETERTILISEKGTTDNYFTAATGFEFFATMNPGGDFGKKELSPALRNRFTEIWVPSMDDFDDMLSIISSRLKQNARILCKPIALFSKWYGDKYGYGNISSGVISLRDILSWVEFINCTFENTSLPTSFVQGAAMTFIDSLGTNNTAYLAEYHKNLVAAKHECLEVLSQVSSFNASENYLGILNIHLTNDFIFAGPYKLKKNSDGNSFIDFNLNAPTTALNASKLIRALQVHKPVLLEGSPGVGKTSLVSALAAIINIRLTRINLSEQTDISDLFGSDVPAEDGSAGSFVWRDAPFLRALQNGEWVLLDEMNLASQSILEGLNACLDHRGEVFIPELGKKFVAHPNFTIFAAQNPHFQGGGRKGLPKSFINRFSVVYVESLTRDDLLSISSHLYTKLDQGLINKFIIFISSLDKELNIEKSFGFDGSPWEFNLRDTLRLLSLHDSKSDVLASDSPDEYIDLVIKQRFRNLEDKKQVDKLYEKVFGIVPRKRELPYYIEPGYMQIGHTLFKRCYYPQYDVSDFQERLLQSDLQYLESILTCILNNWPVILTGPAMSGKTSLIRVASKLNGAKLIEFPMNNDIDSMDLIGGYEQTNIKRSRSSILSDVTNIYRKILTLYYEKVILLDNQTLYKINNFFVNINVNQDGIDLKLLYKDLSELQDNEKINENLELNSVLIKCEAVFENENSNNIPKFKWFDGILVRAIEQGDWIVLDNANLCSPSVLDRLNSLLEPKGVLIVNECSLEDGSPRIIVPHKNFRLFMTVNPKNGELSRAMRNRGVEIYIESIYKRFTSFDFKLLNLQKVNTVSFNKNSIEDSFNQLCLYDNLDSRKAFSFMNINESFLASYTFINELLDKQKKDDDRASSMALMDFIPRSCGRFLNRWRELCFSSNFFTHLDQNFLNRFVYQIEEFSKSEINNYVEKLASNLNNKIDFDRFLDSQPYVFPSMNTYLSKKLFEIDIQIISTVFDLFASVINFKYEIFHKNFKVLSIKLRNCGYLKMLFKGENVLTNSQYINVFFNFMSLGIIFMEKAIFSGIFNLKLIEVVKDFFWILHDFYLYILLEHIEESHFYVYIKLLRKWVKNIPKEISSEPEFTKLSNAIICSSDDSLNSRGQALELLWEKYHPIVPKSKESYENSLNFNKVLSSFDQTADKMLIVYVDEVINIRKFIIDKYYPFIEDDSSSTSLILKKVEALVFDLSSSVSLNSFEKRPLNILASIIYKRLILMYFCGIKEHERFYDDILKLSFYASRSSVELISTLSNNLNADVSDPIFNALLDSDNSKDLSKFLHGSIIVSIFDVRNDILTSKISSLSDSYKTLVDLSQIFSSDLKYHISLKYSFIFILIKKYIKLLNSFDMRMEDADEKVVMDMLQVKKTVERIMVVFKSSTNVLLKKAFETYFNQSIEAILYSIDLSGISYYIGVAYTYFALGMLWLYVPDCPNDPVIVHYVNLWRVTKTNEYYKNLVEKEESLFYLTFGDNENDRISNIKSNIVTSLNTILPAYRPYGEQMKSYFDYISSNYNTLFKIDPINELVEGLIAKSSKALNAEQLLQANCYSFINSLKNSFSYYKDLSDPIIGFVQNLRLGISIVKSSSSHSLKNSSEFNWIFSPTFFINLLAQNKQIINFAKSEPLSISNNILIQNFRGLSLLYMKDNSKVPIKLIDDTLQAIFQNWSVERTLEEKKRLNENSIYKSHDSEENLDEDFKLLFPEYDPNDETALQNSDSNFLRNKSENSSQFVSMLNEIYSSMFGVSSISSNYTDYLIEGVELLNKIKDRILFTDENFNEFFGSLMIYLSSQKQFLSSKIQKSSNFNFYNDSSYFESNKAVLIIKKLESNVKDLLDKWPENEILKNILTSTEQLNSYTIDFPMAKLLAKIEQIYGFVYEWERNTSKEFKLKERLDELTALIIDWRKLELSTWQNLFNFELRNIKQSANKWWFYLYENLIYNPLNMIAEGEEISSISATIISVLNTFLNTSCIGDYEFKVDMASSFANHILHYSNDNEALKRFGCSLLVLCGCYYVNLDFVRKRIQQERNILEKEINEVILLASWKDVNINALKESARRSHYKLYKIVRKFRTFLLQKIDQNIIFNNNIADTPIPLSNNFDILTIYSEYKDNIPEYDLLNLNYKKYFFKECKRSNRLLNIRHVCETMATIEKDYGSIKVIGYDQFVADLLVRMNELKTETPKYLTEENKSLIQGLKSQKKKLFSDTLKSLKFSGLRSTIRADLFKRQSDIQTIISNSVILNENNSKSFDIYFYKILIVLPFVRSICTTPQEDISLDEIQRASGFAECFLSILLSQRDSLYDILSRLNSLNTFKSVFSGLTSASKSNKIVYVHNNNRLEYLIAWLPFAIETSLAMLKSYSYLSLNKSENIESELNNFLKIFKEYQSKKEYLKGKELLTENLMSWRNEFYESLKNFDSFIHSDLIIDNGYQTLFNHIEELFLVNDFPNRTDDYSENIYELDSLFQKASNSILVIFQDVKNLIEKESGDEENENWFIIEQNKYSKLFSKLYLKNISGLLKQIVTICSKIDPDNSAMICSLVSLFNPFLQAYCNIVDITKEILIKNYLSISKSMFQFLRILYNLGSNGFCTPCEKEEEKGDNITTGTGLGDGEGMESASKDVEQDEDLDDYANDEKNKENKEIEDDSDAVDIEGDMEGNIDELSDFEDNEDENEEQNLDEEVNNIDELDPNKVDEKMWEDKDEENGNKDIKDTETNLSDKNHDKTQENSDDIIADDDVSNENNEKKDNDDFESLNEEKNDDNVDENENDDVEKLDDEMGTSDVEEVDDVNMENDATNDFPESEPLDLPDDINLDDLQDKKNHSEEETDELDELVEDDMSQLGEEKDIEQHSDLNDEIDDSTEEGEETNETDTAIPDESEHMESNEDDKEKESLEEEKESLEEENLQKNEDVDDRLENQSNSNTEKTDKVEELKQENMMDDNQDFDSAENTMASTASGSGVKDSAENLLGESSLEQTKALDLALNEDEKQNNEDNLSQDKDLNNPIENQTMESLRKLGDTLEMFHKNKDIVESSEPMNDSSGKNDEELQHVENEEEASDQALGEAPEGVKQSIDESVAIEDDNNTDEDSKDTKPVEDKLETEVPGEDVTMQDFSKFDNSVLPLDNNNMVSQVYNKEVDQDVITDLQNEHDEVMDVINSEEDLSSFRSLEDSRRIWQDLERSTSVLSSSLSEQLRLILEPTLATKLKGNFRTGKRLNMKQIIPYIASSYKKDKIWLRRTKPSKREYQILIAIDDSKSMAQPETVKLAFETISLVSNALTKLESGQLGIIKFGKSAKLIHSLRDPFLSGSGANVINKFGFDQDQTDVNCLVQKSISVFQDAKMDSKEELCRLEIIISDGICENHNNLVRLVREARKEHIFFVFVIIDAVNKNGSIIDMTTVKYESDSNGSMVLKMEKYLEKFPFEYYVIVRNVADLPNILSQILRQFFSELSSAD